MVSDYVLKKREEELEDRQYNKQIPNCQENIDFLNGLKNGKQDFDKLAKNTCQIVLRML